MRRVLVIGSGGAGKSVFATRLAVLTGLPLIHLDALYWMPGWVPTSDDVWAARVARLLEQDRWIMDGNYGRTLPQRLAVCDTVVFLDTPRWLCLWRVLRRQVEYRGRTRESGPAGCPERASIGFLSWVWTYPRRRRPEVLRRLRALPSEVRVHELRTAAEAEAFLERCARASGSPPAGLGTRMAPLAL